MKNKKNTYILLVVVIFIWGLLIYNFFSFTNTEAEIPEVSNTISIKPLAVKERDTFSINVNYRDPFLGKMYQPDTNKRKSGKKIKVKEKAPVLWPRVVYKGIVSDSKDAKKVFMVIIDGHTHFMKEKEEQQEILLKSGDRKSITIQYQGEQNKITIQG